MSEQMAPVEQVDAYHDSSPDRPWRIAGYSAAVGIILSVVWSFHFVDSVIGDNIASALMGEDAKGLTISGAGVGAVFAFVSGLGGTFTACNAAAASAIAPMSEAGKGGRERPARGREMLQVVWRPVAWLTLGMTVVSGGYGFLGVIFSGYLPQLSTEILSSGMPVRLLQASIVFGVIGVAFTWLGLASLGIVPDVFASRPVARVVVIGGLIGAFLVGRPFPLFNKLFLWTAEQGSPLLGAAVFILQSLGNVAVMVALYALMALVARGAALRWLTSSASKSRAVSGALLVALGVFTLVYWDIRLPASFGYGWFPVLPYNA